MKKRIMRIGRIAVAIAAGLILTMVSTACSPGESLDVVGQHSILAFGSVLNAMPEYVAEEEQGGWALTAPDGGARFIWGGGGSQSLGREALLEVEATPFLHAGLDPARLPENYAYKEVEGKPVFMIGPMLGGDASAEGSELAAAPLVAYERLVKAHRQVIGYHMAMDHFHVALGDGNMFEWAKDMALNGAAEETQDKDIVFVLNPAPLIAAGVNPEAVEGWAYAQVPLDMGGDPDDAWKFLKPFDLR